MWRLYWATVAFDVPDLVEEPVLAHTVCVCNLRDIGCRYESALADRRRVRRRF